MRIKIGGWKKSIFSNSPPTVRGDTQVAMVPMVMVVGCYM